MPRRKKREISEKQKDVLEYIEYFIQENGYSPTYGEIAKELGCNIKCVFDKICLLEEKGYISTTPGKSRTIKVLRSLEC